MSAAAKHPQAMRERANPKAHCRVAPPCASWCFRGPALWRPRRADWRYCPCGRNASACRSPSSAAHCPAHRAFLSTSAWPKLKETLDGLGNAPLKTVIDTHWHFDHTDNNANLHAAGATVLAHENTKTRMAEPHDSALLGLHIPASPPDALPQQTFSSSRKLQANGEIVMLQYFQPAHTDTDIYIHFEQANVIHMGDTFFNGFYPVIDTSTGGKVNGIIVAADNILSLADNNTKIVPGHGPLGNKADLTKSRDMLVVARDRVQRLKSAGKSAEEIAASKPLADFDPVWGHMLSSDMFVQMIYSAL